MKKVNGIVVEASEKELLEMFLLSNWHKTCTFDQFRDIMIDEGCKIIEEVEEQCDYQTKDTVQTVQPMILEQEKIVNETVQPTEKTTETVSVIETNQQQTNSVTTVHMETAATTKQQTELIVKNSTTTTDTEKKPSETQDKTTSTNTVLPSKKPVIIINKKKN